MHPTTRAVRDLYARYPYPSTPPTLRLGFDVRRALSFAEVDRPDRPLHVLDAGCSHGAGLIGMASAQPDIRFTGIDVNPVAIERARDLAAQRGLDVRLDVVDLETLEGLEVPEGGFDLIVCSGVVHHLVHPGAGLARLAEVLAPWGVFDLMVYAKAGRVGIERVAAALAEQVPDGPVEQRVERARAIVAAHRGDPAWDEAATLDDIEFADRYLHPRFVSYDLDGLHTLLAEGGLRFLRWTDAAAWDPTGVPGIDDLAGLPDRDLDRVIEAHRRPRMYDLLAVHPGVAARAPVAGADLDEAVWALNPEGVLQAGTRTFWDGPRQVGVTWSHPSRGPLPLHAGAAAVAAPFLTGVGRPFEGAELLRHLARRDVPIEVGRRLLALLERLDVLWRPHAVDVRGRGRLRRVA